jgi:hypothetical protein
MSPKQLTRKNGLNLSPNLFHKKNSAASAMTYTVESPKMVFNQLATKEWRLDHATAISSGRVNKELQHRW